MDNPESSFPTHYYTFYKWGKVGEKGEWVLRGYFNKKRAIEIYNEKAEEKKKELAKRNIKLEDAIKPNPKPDETQSVPEETITEEKPKEPSMEEEKQEQSASQSKLKLDQSTIVAG